MRSRHTHQTSWAQDVVDGKLDAPARPGQPGHNFPAPLTAAELRAIYGRNRTPEVRALLWEIARLRTRLRRADQLRSCIVREDPIARQLLPHVLEALRRELEGEPCLQQDEPGGRHAMIDEEIFSVGRSVGGAERTRRGK